MRPKWHQTFHPEIPYVAILLFSGGVSRAVGAEKGFHLEKFDVAARVGYNIRSSGEVDGLTGLSTGAGITFRQFTLDYALVLFGKLGPTHRISLSARI